LCLSAITSSRFSIDAISTDTDQWTRYDRDKTGERHQYNEANKVAAQIENLTLRRLFLISDKNSVSKELAGVIKEQKESQIEVCCIELAVCEKLIAEHLSNFGLEATNLLICDKSLLTFSTLKTKHDGVASLNPAEIKKYGQFFDDLWDRAQQYDITEALVETCKPNTS